MGRTTRKNAPSKKAQPVSSAAGTAVKKPPPVAAVTPTRVMSLSASSLNSFASIYTGAEDSKQGILPERGLDSFGLRPAAERSRNYYQDKNSKLKCALIGHQAAVFRLEPNDPANANGSWAEKTFFECVKINAPWVIKINIDSTCLKWVHEGIPQKNPKGYDIRLFVIRFKSDGPLAKSGIISLGRYICEKINTVPGNNTLTTLDDKDFFWIEKGVWSDVIGCDASIKELIKTTGTPCPGYYEMHKDAIHTHFHQGALSLELARLMHAPMDEVHPDLRPEVQELEDTEEEEGEEGEQKAGSDEEYCFVDVDEDL